jgi:hypothetical protein
MLGANGKASGEDPVSTSTKKNAFDEKKKVKLKKKKLLNDTFYVCLE